MNKASIATVTAGISLVAAFLALDWSNILKVLGELPGIVTAFTSAMPLKFGSFCLAFGIGSAVWWALWLHPEVCKGRPHICSDLWAAVAGFGVYLVQSWLTYPTSKEMATALFVGVFAGLAAMLVSRVAWSFWAPPKVEP